MSSGASRDERHRLRLAHPGLPARGVDRDRARLAASGPAGPRAGSAPARSPLAFASSIGAFVVTARTRPTDDAPAHLHRSATTRRRSASTSSSGILVDPLSVRDVPGRHRRLDADPPLLDRVHGLRPGYARFFAYLNFFVFSMLLLVLAGNFVLLVVGWAFVGFASYALISFWYRRGDRHDGRHEGVRDQRDRRHRPGPGRVPDLPRARRLRLPDGLRGRRRATSTRTTARSSRSACCSWSARSRSPPSCRSTPGCPTRWRARPRSPR